MNDVNAASYRKWLEMADGNCIPKGGRRVSVPHFSKTMLVWI